MKRSSAPASTQLRRYDELSKRRRCWILPEAASLTPNLQDCLATFSLSAMLNNAEALQKALATIDAFLEPFRHAPTRAAASLRELREAFAAMKLDSAAALAILAEIDARLAAFVGPAKRAGVGA